VQDPNDGRDVMYCRDENIFGKPESAYSEDSKFIFLEEILLQEMHPILALAEEYVHCRVLIFTS
jgi:hypothetical protein